MTTESSAPTEEVPVEGDLLAELDSVLCVDNAPYIGSTTFEELHEKYGLKSVLLDNLYKKGFKRPSRIQSAALPIVLNREKGKRNIIGQGPSGTGKTATYVLGMYNLVDPTKPEYKAICLEPTRELARQTYDVCKELSENTGIETKLLIPGTKLTKGEILPEPVVVGTPGIILKAINETGCINPKDVLMLAVDEADTMLQDNLGEQTAKIKALIPPLAKITLFSATFPEDVKEFADKICPDATKITLKPSEVMLNRIMQLQCRTDEKHDKYNLVYTLFRKLSIGQAIIFTNTIASCNDLAKKLINDEFPVSKLNSKLPKEKRDKVIDDFRNGNTRVLVATNVIARGIDVMQVSLVINYEVPMHTRSDDKSEGDREVDTETYIHRIGRTARFGRSGVALTLIGDDEEQDKLEEILSIIRCECNTISPDKLGEIEGLLKRCRSSDEENLKRLGLEGPKK